MTTALTKEAKIEYNRLIVAAKESESQSESLSLFERAFAIVEDPKLALKIAKLREKCARETAGQENSNPMATATRPPAKEMEEVVVVVDQEVAATTTTTTATTTTTTTTNNSNSSHLSEEEKWNACLARAKACKASGDIYGEWLAYKEASKHGDDENLGKKLEKLARKLDQEEAEAEEARVKADPQQQQQQQQPAEEADGGKPALPRVSRTRTGSHLLEGGLVVRDEVFSQLYDYQQEGVRWLWNVHRGGKGGLLGDDMGLGKTCQVSAFIDALFYSGAASRVLILAPVSVLEGWKKELTKWAPLVRVTVFHGESGVQRERALNDVLDRSGVVLSTYGMVTSNTERLASLPVGRGFDYIILDEGHKIKNHKAQISVAVRAIRSKIRVILTGTPVQNNLTELWALFDFVTHGTLLGDIRSFHITFEGVILAAKDKHATPLQVWKGQEASKELRRVIDPYYLRREKADHLKTLAQPPTVSFANAAPTTSSSSSSSSSPSPSSSSSALASATPSRDPKATAAVQRGLPRKDDLLVWVKLTDAQISLYSGFVKSEQVRSVLNESGSPLAAINVLRKICSHPLLLTDYERHQAEAVPAANADGGGVRGDGGFGEDDDASATTGAAQVDLAANSNNPDLLEDDGETAAPLLSTMSTAELLACSGKLQVLMTLLMRLKAEGHRTLVFSQSLRMLDIIHRLLGEYGLSSCRIDGKVNKASERQAIIDAFNRDAAYDLCLLTTQTGGVGITLTGADRVVLFDSSWNPAVEAQAVDRAYRIGQKRPVLIYRLITCGTIEEKICKKQIFKGGLMKVAAAHEKGDRQHRYFSFKDLRDVFSLGNTLASETHAQLEAIHAPRRFYTQEVADHLGYLGTLGIVGTTDYQLVFTPAAKESFPTPPPEELARHRTPYTTARKAKRAGQQQQDEQMEDEDGGGGIGAADCGGANLITPADLAKLMDEVAIDVDQMEEDAGDRGDIDLRDFESQDGDAGFDRGALVIDLTDDHHDEQQQQDEEQDEQPHPPTPLAVKPPLSPPRPSSSAPAPLVINLAEDSDEDDRMAMEMVKAEVGEAGDVEMSHAREDGGEPEDEDREICQACLRACPYPNIVRCIHFLEPDTLGVYNELIEMAQMPEITPVQRLDLYLEVLELADADPALHRAICQLAQEHPEWGLKFQ